MTASSRPDSRIELLGAPQQNEVQTLFQTVFGTVLTDAHYQWKYVAQTSHAIGLRNAAGVLTGHYAGLARPVRYFGQPVDALQICDVMMAPDTHGSLNRHEAFRTLCAGFLEQFIGYDHPYLLGYGFPTRRAMRVAEHLGIYAETGSMAELSWHPAMRPSQEKLLYGVIPLSQRKGWQNTVAQLWAAMAADFTQHILGVRDAAWLQHRYLDHPARQYQVCLVYHRISRKPVGIIVLRQDGQRLEWVDLIAPRKHWGVLRNVARDTTSRMGCEQLFCWITRPFHLALQTPDGAEHDTGVRIPCNRHTAGPDAATLRDQWLLMGGDTDFR